MLLVLFLLSIVMLGVSIYLRFYIGRRNFNRPAYRSYGHSLRIRVYENLIRFVILVLTLFGLIILITCIVKYLDRKYADKPVQHAERTYYRH